MTKKYNWRLIILSIQILLLGSLALAYYFLNQVCLSVGDCSTFSRRDFWRPLLHSSIIWLIILLPFLFLPTHYFTSYCKKIFWWVAIIFFLTVASNSSNSSEWVDRTDIVFLSGSVTAIITVLFIFLHYRKTKA
jgi:hypothetical protein